MTISEISIPLDKIKRTGGAGQGTIGHDFNLRARLRVSRRTMGTLSGDGIDYPELEWKEIVDWFEHRPDGTWENKGEVKKDMFAANPDSNTFKIWKDHRYFIASDPTNNPPAALKAAVDKAASSNDKEKAAKHWIAENGFEWTIAVTDRPAIGLAGGSGGGGGDSLVTGNSRRRVIYFDLGFKGSPTRVSATQILESINGKPTIHKFFVPGITKDVADNSTNLSRWRTQLAQAETFRP